MTCRRTPHDDGAHCACAITGAHDECCYCGERFCSDCGREYFDHRYAKCSECISKTIRLVQWAESAD